MQIQKNELYRFPWSKTDNPGGWIEVTDKCDISCKGCYRHKLEGHRSIEDIKNDIVEIKSFTNCDFITVAGGEPLIYPQIFEVVSFISELGLKSIIFSNGEQFTYDLGVKLRKAGLSKIHFHVDSEQERDGWQGKTEIELNQLRQELADIVYSIKGLQCGFHVTVYRNRLKEIPNIIDWTLQNTHKVQHISLIAFRGFPVNGNLHYYAKGVEIKVSKFNNSSNDAEEINISTEEIFEQIISNYPYLNPSAYLNGTSKFDSYKFLIIARVGSKSKHYGVLGKKTMEFAQVFYHLFFGKYFTFMNKPNIGKKVFATSLFDKRVRKAFLKFCGLCLRNPMTLFNKTYLQSIHIQQPSEILDGKINMCDDCVNMTVYKGNLVKPCQLDEYRFYGEPLLVMKSDDRLN